MKLKHLIDLFTGIVITILVLTGIDAALGSAGIGEISESNNWSRGFDPAARYLVPIPAVEGAWQTRFKHKSRPEVMIGPKTDKVRVITFGGSNTAGFEVKYLKELLDDAVGEEHFETINLGRPGYGSERVKFIFRQAIEVLDPEIVVIYTGHNEFVERGFMMDLEAASAGDWAEKPTALAHETHIFNAIVQYYSAEAAPRSGVPEEWDNEYLKFSDITYDETEKYFQAYGRNVRTMCEEALAKGVKVVLCTIVHNRMAVPFSSTFPKGMDQDERESFEKLRKIAISRFPNYMGVMLPEKERNRLHGSDLAVRGRIIDQPAEGLDRQNFDGWRDATDFLKDRDPVIQHASRWAPIVAKYYEALQRYQVRDFADKTKTIILSGEKKLIDALKIYPDHPRALFELALFKHLLGRDPAEVVALLERAARLDRAPRKGSDATNDIVKQIAADIDGVVLADIDAAFRACLPNGLVSWEWMADHCHLNRGGRDAIVEQFVKAILENWGTIQVGGATKN
ncbi:MAG: hypothetical protein ACI8X5_001220 [Planctomycetota bacterium]|jgi:hypothetical protein